MTCIFFWEVHKPFDYLSANYTPWHSQVKQLSDATARCQTPAIPKSNTPISKLQAASYLGVCTDIHTFGTRLAWWTFPLLAAETLSQSLFWTAQTHAQASQSECLYFLCRVSAGVAKSPDVSIFHGNLWQ